MKSNEAREMMVERVQAAKARWPSLSDLPDGVTSDYGVSVDAALFGIDPGQAYVKALYAACYRGEPVGRVGMTISSRKFVEKPI
jgi:hypothetical protein